MKIWKITEAYQSALEDEEISGYTNIAKSEEKANNKLRKMIRGRVSDHYSGLDEITDEDINEVVVGILESHDGHGWYRWINDYSHYSWNVSRDEI